VSITVTVENAGNNARPTARISADPQQAKVGQTVTLDASKSTDDNKVEGYRFDFGDGGKTGWQSEGTATHSYSAGEWTAMVTVRDDQGVESANRAEVIITVTELEPGEGPLAIISSPTPGQVFFVGEVVHLDGTDSLGEDLTFEWRSDQDGALSDMDEWNVTLQIEGTHTITLTVTDGNKDTDTATVIIEVKPAGGNGGSDGGSDGDEGLSGPGQPMALMVLGLATLAFGIVRRRR